jgi:hypothetical protein
MGAGSGRLAAATLEAASCGAFGAGASEPGGATAVAGVDCGEVAIAAVTAGTALRIRVSLEGAVSAALRVPAAGVMQSYFHRCAVGMSGIAGMVELRWQPSSETLSRAVAAHDLERIRSLLGFDVTCIAIVSLLARHVFRDIGPTIYKGELPALPDSETAR